MDILGIETSCDETAASVVRDGVKVLSNEVLSTLQIHKKYGGVIPEIATRGHVEAIDIVTRSALRKSGVGLSRIAAIGVTCRPGLPGALLVGGAFARMLKVASLKRLIEVDHIKAHLYAAFLGQKERFKMLPAVGFVVSGGHSSLFYVKDFLNIQSLGATRDDAAGEAFDKVSRILGLSYPGGPVIEKLALKVKKPSLVFKCANILESFDFSFSGIKTAVLYFVQEQKKKTPDLPLRLKAEVAAAFQKAVVEVLVDKAVKACIYKKTKTLLLGGGVAANSFFRSRLKQQARLYNISVLAAPVNLCADNAAMVAGLAFKMINGKGNS